MIELTIAFSVIVVFLGVFVWWRAPSKATGVMLLALLYTGLWFGMADIMGRSKPILIPDEAQIISYYFNEPWAIHVWVLEGEPRAYRLPWDRETAKRLLKATREKGEGGTVIMHYSIQEGEYEFYAQAPRELPPK